MLDVYIAGDSRGYLSHAVTFANCLYCGLPWTRFPIFLVAQFLGGWIAAGIVYGYYYYAIDIYEGVGVPSVPPSKESHGRHILHLPPTFHEQPTPSSGMK